MLVEILRQVLTADNPIAPQGSSGTVTSIASGVAAVIAAYSAFKISKRDNNADDLKNARVALQSQKTLNEDLQSDVLAFKTWAFQVQSQMAGQGIQIPNPPALKSERVQG